MSLVGGSASHHEDRQDGGNPSHGEDRQDGGSPRQSETTIAVQARQRRRIAQLEEQLETLEAGREAKQKYLPHYLHSVTSSHRLSGK
jgi:hypothetical protein